MKIYDLNGEEQNLDWLQQTFGNVQVRGHSDLYRVKELRAIEGPNTLVTTVLEQDGRPQENILITFGWPTIENPDEIVKARTNSGGTAGLGMGGGGYYTPPGETGPHWVMIDENLYVSGLGMLSLTNHVHLDVTFEVQKPPPPEPDVWEERFDMLIERLDWILEELKRIEYNTR